MATIWVIGDNGQPQWVRDALRRAGHVVLGMNSEMAWAYLEKGTDAPDLVVLDLRAEGAYDLAEEFRAVELLCLGRPGDRVDGAMGGLLSAGAPTVPNAAGHEMELVGAVKLQLERAGVTDG